MKKLRLHFRPAPGTPPLAQWGEAPVPTFLEFADPMHAEAAFELVGLETLVFSGEDSLFPHMIPGISAFRGDDDDFLVERALERGLDWLNPQRLPGSCPDVLRFLLWWRLALLEPGAMLELVQEPFAE